MFLQQVSLKRDYAKKIRGRGTFGIGARGVCVRTYAYHLFKCTYIHQTKFMSQNQAQKTAYVTIYVSLFVAKSHVSRDGICKPEMLSKTLIAHNKSK